MRDIENNIIVAKTIAFSLQVIRYCEVLDSKKKFVISNQLLKAATSIGANVFEAQDAESKADFIHKMKLASKEANETCYWLILCEKSEGFDFDIVLKEDLEQIMRIISKIIASTKKVEKES